MLIISYHLLSILNHFFHLPEHGQAKSYEGSEAEANVSTFISQSQNVYNIKQVNLTLKASNVFLINQSYSLCQLL